jgi:hypothetical protein
VGPILTPTVRARWQAEIELEFLGKDSMLTADDRFLLLKCTTKTVAWEPNENLKTFCKKKKTDEVFNVTAIREC